MVAIIWLADPRLTLGGFNRSKFNFTEHGHVEYQIKGNHECSNMVAIIWLADPRLTLREFNRSKFNFTEHGHVEYQIKGNHKCSNMEANILPAAPPPYRQLGLSQKVKFQLFQNIIMLHIKLKES